MDRLLQRQLRRFGATAEHPPADWPAFLAAVDDAYQQSQKDRLLLERSMDLASEELIERNSLLHKEMADRERMETELRLAQKLESVGQLAAGVAHEINTPVQYIGDSLHFLRDACESLRAYVIAARSFVATVPGGAPPLDDVATAADLDYMLCRMPPAFERLFDGLERVSDIVGAMKEFAYPDRSEMGLADINRGIQNTLTVARNEYKYVALVTTDLADLPPVRCRAGEINQAVLNLLVNAAHAVADARPAGDRGIIHVRSWSEGGSVCISVADDGIGIPPEIQSRVFDPFFTTKAVGRGSGQGLAIARAIVVEKHRGTLSFESAPGAGATFLIRIPGADAATAHAA